MSDDLYSRAAQSIGEVLSATAIWQGARCHWPEDTADEGLTLLSRQGCLYSGTAGIGLFLAELSAHYPRAPFVATAKAALRHAFELASCSDDISLFDGISGVVHALRRGSECLADAELMRNHGDLLERLLRTDRLSRFDLFFGTAGCVTLLLTYPEDRRCLDKAELMGRDLCDCADWQDDSCCWDAMTGSGLTCPPLGGLSHGAAGIAAALMALYAATGDFEFLATGRAAFAYDELLYDRQHNCWLDLRFTNSLEHARASGAAMTAWCHGAPGIALARLLAAQCDKDQAAEHLRVLQNAAAATMTGLESMTAAASSCDATLCHGAFGLIDVLNSLRASLHENRYKRAAEAAALRFTELTMTGHDWLAGPAQPAGPSLMRGMAGIGHALLRLSQPDRIPSVLLLLL